MAIDRSPIAALKKQEPSFLS